MSSGFWSSGPVDWICRKQKNEQWTIYHRIHIDTPLGSIWNRMTTSNNLACQASLPWCHHHLSRIDCAISNLLCMFRNGVIRDLFIHTESQILNFDWCKNSLKSVTKAQSIVISFRCWESSIEFTFAISWKIENQLPNRLVQNQWNHLAISSSEGFGQLCLRLPDSLDLLGCMVQFWLESIWQKSTIAQSRLLMASMMGWFWQ